VNTPGVLGETAGVVGDATLKVVVVEVAPTRVISGIVVWVGMATSTLAARLSRNPVLTMKTVLVRPTSTSHNLAPTLSLTQDTAHGAYSSVILKTFLQPLLGLAYTTTKQTIPLLSIQSYWPQHAAELSTSSQIPRSVQPPLRKPLQYYRRSIPCRRPQSERLERFTLSRC
jgi:hypothetical protein